MADHESDAFNCSASILTGNTVCLDHPEEMLKPWKSNPLFFEIIIIHVMVFVFGVAGNAVVVLVMAGDRKSRNATNFFLVSLAVGDLLMLCVYGPLETYTHFVIRWDERGAVCKTAKFAEFLSATSSVLNLLAVTVERFVVIIFPMKSQAICTASNMIKAIVCVWLFSMIFALPILFTTNTYKITFTNNLTSLTLNYCTNSGESLDFVVYQFFIIFLIPSITMTVCYCFVIRELWISTKKMSFLTNELGSGSRKENSKKSLNSRHDEPKKERGFKSDVIVTVNKHEANNARKQVIKMLILVIVLFYVCWGPRVSMDVLQKFNMVPFDQFAYRMRIIFNLMTFFHGSVNPFIYSFMSRNFRARLSMCLEKKGCRRSKWSRRLGANRSDSVRYHHHGSNSSKRRNFDERHATAKLYGSFLSCETKTTESESVFHLPPGPSSF